MGRLSPIVPALKKLWLKPVAAPPSDDPVSATVDVYYEISHAPIDLRPGQRVGVSIPVSEEVEALVLPARASYTTSMEAPGCMNVSRIASMQGVESIFSGLMGTSVVENRSRLNVGRDQRSC